jgi:predicted nucleic-acid-binding protein
MPIARDRAGPPQSVRFVQVRNCRCLLGLLESVELFFEDEGSIEQALYMWKDSAAQFADCLIGARHWALECRATASFDAKALRLPGLFPA